MNLDTLHATGNPLAIHAALYRNCIERTRAAQSRRKTCQLCDTPISNRHNVTWCSEHRTVEATCKVCGETFTYERREKERRICSVACVNENNRKA